MQSRDFLKALTVRRSIYTLAAKSHVPDERLAAVVKHTLLHVPSAFNVQTARCLLLLGREHQKLWDMVSDILKPTFPPQAWEFFGPKIQGYRNGYGTCIFFDDMTAWNKIEQNIGPQRWAGVSTMAEEWTQHSAGMHHYAVWTALSLAGLAGNLQHYKMPPVVAQIKRTWNIPEHWVLTAQLVFGTPTGGPRDEKKFESVEGQRMFVRKS